MPVRTLALSSPDETAAFGARLAALLQTGDLILLHGELGAGKTTLARAVIEAACGVADAPSPTYTLAQSYARPDGFTLLHADLYRVEDVGELEELGFDEALDTGAALVEWPDRLGGRTPPDRLEIVLEEGGALARKVIVSAYGTWEERLDAL